MRHLQVPTPPHHHTSATPYFSSPHHHTTPLPLRIYSRIPHGCGTAEIIFPPFLVRGGSKPSQWKILGGFLEPHVGRLRRSQTETWLMLHLQWVISSLDWSVPLRSRRLEDKISEPIKTGPARAAPVEDAERKSGGQWVTLRQHRPVLISRQPPGSPLLSQSEVSSPTSDRPQGVHVGLIQRDLHHTINGHGSGNRLSGTMGSKHATVANGKWASKR